MAKKKAVKAKQLPIVPKAKNVGTKKSSAKFVSFTVTATIPVQSYGNIQPKIEVQAATYEEARAFAMPLIEQLYAHYSESKPGFLGKITETVKVVAAPVGGSGGTVQAAPALVTYQATTPAAPQATASAGKPKTDAVLKAEKAISLALSEDAMLAIQGQIEKSTKIAEEDKPDLLTLCLKRRGELSK